MSQMNPFFLRLCFAASMLAGTCIVVAPANAASITFNFTGTVNSVGNNLGSGTFSNGQTLTGSYTFNSLTPDSNGGATMGTYNGTVSNLVVNIGSYNATLGAGSNSIGVSNLSSADTYTLTAPFSGISVNGKSPNFFEIQLKDTSHTAFSNDSLPTTPPSLASFGTKTFRLVFSGGGQTTVSGVLTSLTAVPLPAAVLLFGGGLIALAGLGAGGWRNRKTLSRNQKEIVRTTQPALWR